VAVAVGKVLMGLEIMLVAVAAQVALELELGLPLRPGSLIRSQLALVEESM
jgi:hypothetical protein